MHYKNKLFVAKRKAFTLIELLIVIAIIGILFIVLVSKVDFATDKAKATGVQTDFRSFQVAIESVAKENAGLATFGWDAGDTNGDRIRNSYDKGDVNKNGKQDSGEVFVGSKTYGETWTNVYTLTNPADANDKSAIIALEEAINKNLDPNTIVITCVILYAKIKPLAVRNMITKINVDLVGTV
jgi:prepilin-type N-terminal cleavage/methylation domain-containing protein